MTRGDLPLADAFTSAVAKQRYVRRLFSTIADRYDLITILLSFGLDRRWKKRAIDLAAIQPSARVLDLACGTGDLAFAAASRRASVVGLDVTLRMVELAKAKPAGHQVKFIVGDMVWLPFPAGSFDVITTGYGLRNVPDLRAAVREMHRVLRPGGLAVSLDFNRPASVLVRSVYLAYLSVVGGALGWLLHRNPDTYRYIPESIRRYPGAPAVAELMKGEGFARAEWQPVLGGLMAIHLARK
jgi:ubiquinone/menaquinone biosynthesis methyltransferase